MGTEACTACHADIAKDFRHAFHTLLGVEGVPIVFGNIGVAGGARVGSRPGLSPTGNGF